MTARARWRGLPPWARWVTGIVIAVVAVNVLLSVLRDAYRGPEGRPSSSYATAPNGIAAYAELLARRGYPVAPLRGSLSENLPDDGLLVVLDPDMMSRDEATVLAEWVAAGGRLVIGGRPDLWAAALMDERAPDWSAAGILSAEPLADVGETRQVTTIGGAGHGSWADTGAALPIVGLESSPARNLVAVAAIGAGRAVLIADTSILHNRYLARNDNAVFALNIAGAVGTPVYFAEGVHGYGSETGLAAIPPRWKFALGGLALAVIVWMLAVGRRLGPPEPAARDLPPARRAYVEALTTTLARTKRSNEVVAPVRAAARAKLARRAGLESNADDSSLEGAGRAMGLTNEELAAILGRSDGNVVAVGRAVTKLGGRDW